MKQTNRLLSLLLCIVMLISMLPVSAFAAEEQVDYLFLATDRHANTSIIKTLLSKVDSSIGDGALDYVGLGGDMVNNQSSYKSSTILSEVQSGADHMTAANVDILQGSHDSGCSDDAGILNETSGLWMELDHTYVYGVVQSDMENASSASTAAAVFTDWAASLTDDKAIIVLSHMPIHANRGDNSGAGYWHNALNAAATGSASGTEITRNVAFFHGHNHTVDKTEYYYAPGSTMSIESYVSASGISLIAEDVMSIYDEEIEAYASSSGTNATIYYTYATAGYLNANQKASLVTVDEDTITFQKVSTSGPTKLGSVDRAVEETEPEVTEKTVSYIVVSNGNGSPFYLGEKLIYNVTVTYSDGTQETVDYTACDVTSIKDAVTGEEVEMDLTDLQVEGEFVATITYGGKETTMSFTVSEQEEGTVNYNTLELAISGATLYDHVTLVESDATVEGVTDSVVYNIPATLDEGVTEATVSIPVPTDWVVGKLRVFHILDDGTVSDEVFEGIYANGKYTFTTTHFSTWMLGNMELTVEDEGPSQDVTTDGTTTEEVTIYKLVSAITSGNEYLIVNTNSATTSGHALGHSGNSIADDSVTIIDGTNVTGIDAMYILDTDVDSASVWTATNSGNYSTSYTFANNSYYLRYSGSELSVSNRNSTFWTYNNNQLYYTSSRSWPSSTYYIRYNNNSWSASTSSSNVYLYEKTTATVTTSTKVTYSMSASDLTAVVDSTHLTGKLTYELLGNGASLTTLPAGGSYSFTVASDESGIISAIDADGNITFTGATGEAAVKIAYTWGENVVYKYVTVTTSAPYYTIEITETVTGEDGSVTNGDIIADGHIISLKGDNTTVTLGAKVTYHGPDGATDVNNPTITWYTDSTAATVTDGVVVFTKDGSATVTASYKANDNTDVVDEVELHYTTSAYTVPEDGTNDFPEYPNEGAIRFDKTATGVNWADSAVTKVELSLTGVPYTKGSEIDVVMMLDLTGSMTTTRIAATAAAAQVFLDQIVKNEDGSFNENRIAICYFNANGAGTIYSLATVTKENYDTVCGYLTSTALTAFQAKGGTPYDEGLSKVDEILTAARTDGTGNERMQFCLFMSDGAPTAYKGTDEEDYSWNNGSYESSWFTGNSTDGYTATSSFVDEYYSQKMKAEGVTMYSVGLGITDTRAHVILERIASKTSSYFKVADSNSTDGLSGAFASVAKEIKQAATEAQVKDGISDYYDLYAGGESADDNFGVDGSTAGQYPITISEWTLDPDTHQRQTETVIATVKLIMSATDNADAATVTGAEITYADGTVRQGIFNNGSLKIPTQDGTGLLVSYDVARKEFVWEVETVRSTELVLSYYVILKEEYRDTAATYPTNSYANLTYLNYQDVECQVEFPEPQMTWLGAQVSYVFYLVNDQGQPVNHAGKVVPIGEAIYVSDVFTYSKLWSEEEVKLEAEYLASDLLPDVYKLYDAAASYTIHAYQTADHGNDSFKITGSEGKDIGTNGETTTYVFNNKSDTTKYNIRDVEYTKTNASGIDFHNTTVAFAVVWTPSLNPDTVVIDFGLPVNINVTANDYVNATVAGVSAAAPNADINSGLLLTKPDYSSSVTTEHGEFKAGGEYIVTYTPGDMEMTAPETVYYVAEATFYVYDTVQTGYMYSSVTVIPATTIYYEDSFLELKNFSTDGTVLAGGWDYSESSGVQDTDRPSENEIGSIYDDADNNYGYDSHYANMTTHSLDSAAKITVTEGVNYGTASFTFTGTGFDIISMTSNTTGTLFVKITQNGTLFKNLIVDTYYGYTYNSETGEWILVDSTAPNALYQVPVMKWEGAYGTYDVTITASYAEAFDHQQGTNSYDLYLDAIRIYNPTGNLNDEANNAYVADGEGWPVYTELRNNIIAADDAVGSFSSNGAVFIDGKGETAAVEDYKSYGPNNEVYLAKNQAIAFNIAAADAADVQLGIKSADGSRVTYQINGDSYTVSTAADLYYSIKQYADTTITIQNVSDGILSLTNVKVTYPTDPGAVSVASLMWMDEPSTEAAIMCLSLDYEEPDVEVPTEPEVTEPEVTEPEVTEPEVTEPEVTEPEVTEPEPTEPEVTEPEPTEPEPTKPSIGSIITGFIKNFINKFFSRWF